MPQKLGQHFLNNPQIVEQISQATNLNEVDAILEIGPGEGILTEKLSQFGKKVIAIEIDQSLRSQLENKFKNTNNLEIIYADILSVNLPQILKERNINSYKLIANIPYYITAKIIRLFLESETQPREIILMIQKEVAQRIVSKSGKMSILSISIGYYAKSEILFDVTRENFNPPPEIDSSVIRIFDIKKNEPSEKKQFFKIVKAGFCAKRKTLINNLSNSLHLSKEDLEEKLISLGFSKNTRAQELSVKDWIKLSSLLK